MSSTSSDDKGAEPPPVKKHPMQHFLAGACAGVVEVSLLVRSIIQMLASGNGVVVVRPVLHHSISLARSHSFLLFCSI
jgi:hypothetical protein